MGMRSSLAIVGLLVLAAPAQAGVVRLGSDLSRPADAVEAHGADTAFWQRSLPSGDPVRVPTKGQIRAVRIRGYADSTSDYRFGDPGPFQGGERLFHVQVLEPQGDGRYRIRENGTSNHLYMPGPKQGAGPGTITTFELENLCVEPGDAVAFNTVGGFNRDRYPSGTPLHIFADVPGAKLDLFEGADQTNNGATISATPKDDRELLMQMELATGLDASFPCRDPSLAPPPVPGAAPRHFASVPKQRITVPRSGRIAVSLFCLSTTRACPGTVAVRDTKGRVLAQGRYAVPSKRTGKVSLKLSAAGFRAVTRSRSRGLPVKIVAVTDRGAGSSSRSIVLRRRGA